MRWKFTLNPDTDNKVISEPIGWADIVFTLRRDKKWHGVFFEYSLPLKFYDDPTDATKDAYTFLKTEYELNGVNGMAILKVEYAGSDTDAFTEEGQWRLEFVSYVEECSEVCLIEMNLAANNHLMTFRNRYDQKVNLDADFSFDGTTALTPYTALPISVSLPPITVLQQADLETVPSGVISYSEADVVLNGIGTSTQNIIGYVNWNLVPVGGLDEIDTRNLAVNEFVQFADITPIYTMQYAGEYTFTFDLQGTSGASVITTANNTTCVGDDKFNEFDIQVWIDAAGVPELLHSANYVGCYSSIADPSIPLAGVVRTYNLAANDEVKIYVRLEATGEYNRALVDKDVDFTITFNGLLNLNVQGKTLSVSSNHNLYLVNEVGSRIIEAITDDNMRFLSNYYGRTDSEPYAAPEGADGIGSLKALTTGLELRDAFLPQLTMSFEEFFDGLTAIDNVGIGIEDDTARAGYEVIRCESVPYFYGTAVLIQLDKIPAVTIKPAADEIFSTLRIGYEKWEAEEYYGLDEWNTERTYRTDLSSVRNELQQISKFIASGYAIEITRRFKIYSSVTKEDWRFDYDTFIICLKRGSSDPYDVEQGNITASANMVDSTTIYNYRISPVRNAMRWLKTVLNAYRDPTLGASKLIFTDGKGNVIAEGLMTGANVIESASTAENADVNSTSVGDPIVALPPYIPEEWAFEYPLSLAQYASLKASPKDVIQGRFKQDANYRDFYIREVAYRSNDGMASFTLLPGRSYPVDECSIYIVQTRGTGITTVGSALLVGADIENLFLFVDGALMKYNDSNAANNEIVSFNTATGYFTLQSPVGSGRQVSIIHIPPGDGRCDVCIHRFEGRGSGVVTKTLTGFGSGSMSNMFVFYNGELMKYNDANPANNEVTGYVSGTEVLTFAGATNVNRELRVFGFANCSCIKTFSGRGDGTTSPTVSGLGTGTLANVFVFYNGNLMKYNDNNPANNEITVYDSAVPEVILSFPTNANRELRAFKLENC